MNEFKFFCTAAAALVLGFFLFERVLSAFTGNPPTDPTCWMVVLFGIMAVKSD